jgi:hypothetical protein
MSYSDHTAECPRCFCGMRGATCEECGYEKPAAPKPTAPKGLRADGSFEHWPKSEVEIAARRLRDGRKLGQYKLIPKAVLDATLVRINEEHRLLCEGTVADLRERGILGAESQK